MTDHYAVFGNPIVQSKSPFIHRMFAEQTKQDMHYDKQEVSPEGFIAAADEFFLSGGRGLNITAPFKQDAFNYAHSLSEGAKTAGAVNTLIKQADGSIHGDNTDGIGLVSDISERLAWEIQDKNVLVLGAGGAVRGVLYPLLKKRPKQLSIANRTLSKAQTLAENFKAFGKIQAREFQSADEKVFDLIINGTSTSLSGDLPPLNPACIGPHTFVYDMVYANKPTPFMQWAKNNGAKACADGKGMLVGQAAESFRLWRGLKPDVVSVLAALEAL